MSVPDHVQITNLLYRYAELLDSGDFAGVGDLFREGRITVEGTGDEYTGADEVAAMYVQWTRLYSDNGTPHTRHVTTNPIIEIDDDGLHARTRSYVTVFQRTDELALQPIFTNRYVDDFESVAGKWRFAHRRMVDAYAGDLSRHLMQDFPADSEGDR